MGTMARTRMPFQLKRLIILDICVGRSAPTKGAMISRRSRKPVMIRRGTPKFFSEAITFSFILYSYAALQSGTLKRFRRSENGEGSAEVWTVSRHKPLE